jgi:hypothetical protein
MSSISPCYDTDQRWAPCWPHHRSASIVPGPFRSAIMPLTVTTATRAIRYSYWPPAPIQRDIQSAAALFRVVRTPRLIAAHRPDDGINCHVLTACLATRRVGPIRNVELETTANNPDHHCHNDRFITLHSVTDRSGGTITATGEVPVRKRILSPFVESDQIAAEAAREAAHDRTSPTETVAQRARLLRGGQIGPDRVEFPVEPQDQNQPRQRSPGRSQL